MLKLVWLGLAGTMIVCASGLMLRKNSFSHAATPPRHDHARRITTLFLQEQGHLPTPSMGQKKTGESKTSNVLLEESKEPPLLQKEEIKPVQFQPMKEELTLPLFPPAPNPAPSLIPPIEDNKKPVVEDKKQTPAKLPVQIQDDVITTAPGSSQPIDLPRVIEGILGGIKSANIRQDEPKNGSITMGFEVGSLKPPFIKFEVNSRLKTNKSSNATTKVTQTDAPKLYLVRFDSENFQEIAKKTLGNEDRWREIALLNPTLKAEDPLEKGSVVKVPADATLQTEPSSSTVQPLPEARPKLPEAKSKIIITLTGTYPCVLQDKKSLVLPAEVFDQLGNCNQVLISPGPDPCLWLTSVDHLEKLSERLEHSPASEKDVRVFRRLFFGQIEKIPVQDGKIVIPERMAQFGNLEKEIAIVGVEDHFEIWDLERWRKYTQKMSSLEKK